MTGSFIQLGPRRSLLNVQCGIPKTELSQRGKDISSKKRRRPGGVESADELNGGDDDALRTTSILQTKVVVDIAACDGPVFFERVLNKAYAENVRTKYKL